MNRPDLEALRDEARKDNFGSLVPSDVRVIIAYALHLEQEREQVGSAVNTSIVWVDCGWVDRGLMDGKLDCGQRFVSGVGELDLCVRGPKWTVTFRGAIVASGCAPTGFAPGTTDIDMAKAYIDAAKFQAEAAARFFATAILTSLGTKT